MGYGTCLVPEGGRGKSNQGWSHPTPEYKCLCQASPPFQAFPFHSNPHDVTLSFSPPTTSVCHRQLLRSPWIRTATVAASPARCSLLSSSLSILIHYAPLSQLPRYPAVTLAPRRTRIPNFPADTPSFFEQHLGHRHSSPSFNCAFHPVVPQSLLAAFITSLSSNPGPYLPQTQFISKPTRKTLESFHRTLGFSLPPSCNLNFLSPLPNPLRILSYSLPDARPYARSRHSYNIHIPRIPSPISEASSHQSSLPEPTSLLSSSPPVLSYALYLSLLVSCRQPYSPSYSYSFPPVSPRHVSHNQHLTVALTLVTFPLHLTLGSPSFLVAPQSCSGLSCQLLHRLSTPWSPCPLVHSIVLLYAHASRAPLCAPSSFASFLPMSTASC